MKRSNWFYLFSIFLFGLGGLFYVIKTTDSIKFISLNTYWLLLTLFFFFLWWIFDSLSLLVIFQTAGIKANFFVIFKAMLVGFFFGAITPFNSGTLPSIILYLKKQGISIRKSLSPVLMKTLINGFARALASLLLAFYYLNTTTGEISRLIQGILLTYGIIILAVYFNP